VGGCLGQDSRRSVRRLHIEWLRFFRVLLSVLRSHLLNSFLIIRLFRLGMVCTIGVLLNVVQPEQSCSV
jgi:hypothetical protein